MRGGVHYLFLVVAAKHLCEVKTSSCDALACGLGVHHEQLRVVEERDSLLTALDPREVFLLDARVEGRS
jgi:hypothetical protein